MIKIRTNTSSVLSNLERKIMALSSTDDMLRDIAVNLLPEVRHRIHTDGMDASENLIGEYSPGYMSVRTGIFKSNKTFTRGKQKGETKPEGVFIKGKNKGQPRPTFNRTNDTKVVASLTRQMENDLSVLATEKGYGLGYKNAENAKKAEYVEGTYKKKTFALTAGEHQKVTPITKDFVRRTINA